MAPMCRSLSLDSKIATHFLGGKGVNDNRCEKNGYKIEHVPDPLFHIPFLFVSIFFTRDER